MLRKLSLCVAVAACLGVLATSAWGQFRPYYLQPKVSDPVEKQDLLTVLDAAEHAEVNFTPAVADELSQVLQSWPTWEYADYLRIDLASAETQMKQYSAAASLASSVRDANLMTSPDIAAAADVALGINSYHAGDKVGALTNFKAAQDYLPILQNPGPALRALEQTAVAVRHFALLNTNPLNISPDDKDGTAWWQSVRIMALTLPGYRNLPEARKEYAAFKQSLPAGDRRVALVGARLSAEEARLWEGNRRWPKLLSDSEQLLSYLETNYPNEEYLLAFVRETLAGVLYRTKADLPQSEQLLRSVISGCPDCQSLPTVHSLLAEVLRGEKRLSEAAAEELYVKDNYPYSSWADFTIMMYAHTLADLGDKASAVSVLKDLATQYPKSSWAGYGGLMAKELSQ